MRIPDAIAASLRTTESDSGFYNYETVAYASRLVIGQGGHVARFMRTQRIKFLDDRVGVLFDHVWGDGVLLAGYDPGTASIVDAMRTHKGYVVVLDLPERFRKGETYELTTERRIVGAFTDREAFWELAMSAPTENVTLDVEAPHRRALSGAEVVVPSLEGLSVERSKSAIRIRLSNPQLHVPYRLQWHWN